MTAKAAARDIRSAFVGEAKAITALIERAYRGEESKRGWTSEADLLNGPRTTVEEIKGLLADPQSRFLVAAESGALTACALIRNENGIGYFGMFAVRPDLQGAGLGRTVLEAAERHVRALWGCRALTMTVINLREDLIAYYERRGYRRTGEQKPFPFAQAPGATRTDFHLVVLRRELS